MEATTSLQVNLGSDILSLFLYSIPRSKFLGPAQSQEGELHKVTNIRTGVLELLVKAASLYTTAFPILKQN